jgi:hypothetical protein
MTLDLTVLPGTPYSRYALPLDYEPSRDLRPRYGRSQPKIAALDVWFESCITEYAQFLDYMRSLEVGHIATRFAVDGGPKPAWVGGAISAFDALALYGMIRKHTPKCYLEIGSGMTTCFARQAIADGGLDTHIVSLDPDPRTDIDGLCDHVIRTGLETCDVRIVDRLEPGDILFVDGSHRAFMNSDVTVFFIDILPRVKPGVIVHMHDITLPYDYPDAFTHWYWNEQYMLAVYMMASRDRLLPLLPTAYICRSPLMQEHFATPFVDLGDANFLWRDGGSMWFSKRP